MTRTVAAGVAEGAEVFGKLGGFRGGEAGPADREEVGAAGHRSSKLSGDSRAADGLQRRGRSDLRLTALRSWSFGTARYQARLGRGKIGAASHRWRYRNALQRLIGRIGLGVILKREAKAEMEGAGIFARARVGIVAVIEPDRADRQFVAQPDADGVTHVIEAGGDARKRVVRVRQQIAGVEKDRAEQFAINRESVFDIEDGEELAADGMIVVVRAEVAFGEAAHRVGCRH